MPRVNKSPHATSGSLDTSNPFARFSFGRPESVRLKVRYGEPDTAQVDRALDAMEDARASLVASGAKLAGVERLNRLSAKDRYERDLARSPGRATYNVLDGV